MGEDSCNSLSFEQCTTQIGPKKELKEASEAEEVWLSFVEWPILQIPYSLKFFFKGTRFLQQHTIRLI